MVCIHVARVVTMEIRKTYIIFAVNTNSSEYMLMCSASHNHEIQKISFCLPISFIILVAISCVLLPKLIFIGCH